MLEISNLLIDNELTHLIIATVRQRGFIRLGVPRGRIFRIRHVFSEFRLGAQPHHCPWLVAVLRHDGAVYSSAAHHGSSVLKLKT